MKYKVGDKVRISKDCNVWEDAEKILKSLDYVLTIRSIIKEYDYYTMKEVSYTWADYQIEKIISPFPTRIDEIINSRFEILDL